MALRTRGDYYRADTGIVSQRLVPTSRLVATITGIQVPRNKAIVGRNAFAHEAGIHQDGMLKERSTYEIMRPEDVGLERTDLVLGKHSGRAALADRVRALGYVLSAEQVNQIFEKFKLLADRKKEIYDGDIAALCEDQFCEFPEEFSLASYDISCTSGGSPRVTLRLQHGRGEGSSEEKVAEVAAGDGPIDGIFLAIEQATGVTTRCRDFRVQAVTVGKDAQAEVTVELEHEGQLHRGRGVSTDSLEASAKAFLMAINRALAGGPPKLHPQRP